MATYDDILGNGGGTPFPKGSKEWHEPDNKTVLLHLHL